MLVLLLNDNPAVSRLFRLTCEKNGHTLDEANTIEDVSREEYDAIFMDSDTYSEELFEKLTNSIVFAKSIFISPKGGGKPSGFDIAIDKPFLPTDLGTLLGSLKTDGSNSADSLDSLKINDIEDIGELEDLEDLNSIDELILDGYKENSDDNDEFESLENIDDLVEQKEIQNSQEQEKQEALEQSEYDELDLEIDEEEPQGIEQDQNTMQTQEEVGGVSEEAIQDNSMDELESLGDFEIAEEDFQEDEEESLQEATKDFAEDETWQDRSLSVLHEEDVNEVKELLDGEEDDLGGGEIGGFDEDGELDEMSELDDKIDTATIEEAQDTEEVQESLEMMADKDLKDEDIGQIDEIENVQDLCLDDLNDEAIQEAYQTSNSADDLPEQTEEYLKDDNMTQDEPMELEDIQEDEELMQIDIDEDEKNDGLEQIEDLDIQEIEHGESEELEELEELEESKTKIQDENIEDPEEIDDLLTSKDNISEISVSNDEFGSLTQEALAEALGEEYEEEGDKEDVKEGEEEQEEESCSHDAKDVEKSENMENIGLQANNPLVLNGVSEAIAGQIQQNLASSIQNIIDAKTLREALEGLELDIKISFKRAGS